MYCPNCGQERPSPDTVYCTRCGMPFGAVAAVVANGGFFPQLAAGETQHGPKWLTRRNGAGFAFAWFMFFILFAIVTGGILNIEVLGELGAAFAFFGGFFWLVSSFIFLRPASKAHPAVPPEMQVGPLYELPPERVRPAATYMPPENGSWRDTSDLSSRSVTESTTTLLKERERK